MTAGTATADLPAFTSFSLLGPVRARRGRAELDAGPRQQRALLAVLLVRANQLVTVDDMIGLLWDQDPPGSAVNIIHKYIGCIRRLLEPGLAARASGCWLTRHGDAYRLAADENMSDLMAFQRLAKEARSAHADGRPADALDLFLEALGLWRGACGEDLWLHGRTHDYLAAVDQEHSAAVSTAADAALASAQPLRMLAPLRQAALAEPLNESLQARLMLVLAASGQQASALAHYQAVSNRLSEELGVDPGAELRAAHGKVLRQEFPAVAAGGPSDCPAVPAPPGRPGGPPLPGPSPLVPPAQLPADLPTFADCEAELAQPPEALSPAVGLPAAVAVCAITGMAGIGKTAFAVHWAHRLAGRFGDGQLYINLRGFDPGDPPVAPADALATLLCSLGVPAGGIPDGLDARTGMYRSILAGQRVLIVLDNARDGQQVRPLLPGSPGCLVMVTSRNPLAGLVMTEGARLVTLKLPTAEVARDALKRRLGRDRVAAEPAAVTDIIELCGRLPLALAAVSARAAAHPGFTLASVAADLRRTRWRLDAFAAAGMAADPRSVFSWSYRQLSPRAGRLFRLLPAQPAADITPAASARLLGVSPAEANRLVVELTNAGLLTEHRPGRYLFHDLVRAYAAELSESTGTTAGSREYPEREQVTAAPAG